MTGIDLPPSSPLVAFVFLMIYVFSLSKLVKTNFPNLHFRIFGQGSNVSHRPVKELSSHDSPFAKASALSIEKESTFFTDWWCDDNIFQLERRAIFSKVLSNYSTLTILAKNVTELDLRNTP
jgi:hypothetical protein